MINDIDWAKVQYVAQVVRSDWNIAIVQALADGPLLYSRLKAAIESGPLMRGYVLHDSTLSRKLQALAELDVVWRHQLSEGYQPNVKYGLTAFGDHVLRVLREAGQDLSQGHACR